MTNKSHNHILFLIISLLTCGILLKAQNVSHSFITKTYTSQDGLPHPYTFVAMQDSRGYLWIGANGLSRFDGYNFYNYSLGNTVKNITISCINEGKDGRIWVYSGSSLYIVNGKEIHPVFNGKPLYLTIVYGEKDMKHPEWWTYTKKGFNRVDGSSAYKPIPIPGLGKIECRRAVATENGWYYNTMHDIIFAGKNGEIKTIKELLPPFRYIVIMGYWNNELYFYTNIGIYAYKNGYARTLFQKQLSGKRIFTSYRDPQNRIWVATKADGILVSEPGQEEIFNYKIKLSHNLVSSFYTDREGNTWITYFEGLVKVHELHYESFLKDNYPFLSDLNLIFKDKNGSVFLFSETNGMISWNKEKFLYDKNNFFKGRLVDAICQDEKKRQWCLTRQGNLLLLDGEKKSIIQDKTIVSNSERGWGWEILYDDFRKKIWCPGSFLLLGDDKKFSVFTDGTNKKITAPERLLYLGNGKIIIKTSLNELFLIDSTDKIKNLNTSNQLIPERIHKLFLDSSDNIWISYPGIGLLQARIINNSLRIINRITNVNGLKNDVIQSMAFDKYGRMWISTMDGIEVIDLKNGIVNGPFIYVIGKEDGIPDNGLEYGRLVCDDSSNMWFSSQNAVIKFHVNEMKFTSSPPSVTIENILLNNEETNWTHYTDSLSGIFQLPYDPVMKYYENTITLAFKAVSMINTQSYQYSYKVKGLDNNWSAGSTSNTITLTRLPPGKYTFYVRARRNNSDWSEPTSFSFTIRHALWQHWWFTPFLITVLTFCIYWLYRFRLTQIRKEEKMRRHLASDLHDDIGSTLSSISYYSEAIKQQIKETTPHIIPLLDKMEKASDSTVNAMSDIVWAINPMNDKGANILNRMHDYAIEMCRIKNIMLEFDADKSFESSKLNMYVRKNLYLIFKEAVNNALKYSGCTRMSIRLTQKENHISMQIQDNGNGFDVEEDFRGIGLKNIRQRAEELKAEIQIVSKKGEGSSIILKL